MQTVKNFLAKYNITTHSLFGVWAALMLFYDTNSQVHDYVNGAAVALYHILPSWLGKFIVSFAVPFVIWYRKGNPQTQQNAKAPSAGPSKLAAVLCGVILLSWVSISTIGCTSAQVSTVVKDIGIYAGEAGPVVADVLQLVSVFAASPGGDGEYASSLQKVSEQIQADLGTLSQLCQDYTSHPSSSTWKSIVAEVDSLVANGDNALLGAAHISNPASKQQVQAALASLDALLHVIDGFTQSQLSPAQVRAKAQNRAARLRQVSQYWSEKDREQVGRAFHQSFDQVYREAVALGF